MSVDMLTSYSSRVTSADETEPFLLQFCNQTTFRITAVMYVSRYVCMRAFVTRRSYSLSSHECASVSQTEKMCL